MFTLSTEVEQKKVRAEDNDDEPYDRVASWLLTDVQVV